MQTVFDIPTIAPIIGVILFALALSIPFYSSARIGTGSIRPLVWGALIRMTLLCTAATFLCLVPKIMGN
jgi:hypothetical protein